MKCATCTGQASPGKLLCEQCRGYAQELEDIRLRLPLRLSFALTLALTGCGSATTAVPCDAHDRAAQVDLAAELAACTAKIDACSTQVCVDEVEVEAECNSYGDKRCAEAGK